MRAVQWIATGFALSLMATTALGADYPTLRGSQHETPPPPTVYGSTATSNGINWDGLTIGVHAGVSRSYFDFDNSLQTVASGPLRQTILLSEQNPPGWIRTRSGEDRGMNFGGAIGYNYMIDDILLGFEADYTRINQGHTSADFIARQVGTSDGTTHNVTLTSNQTVRLDDYATARIRIGAAYGRFLPFLTLGGAVGRFDVNKSVRIDYAFRQNGAPNFNNALGFPTTATDNRKSHYGYGLAAGAGVDVAITDFAFIRGEYQFVRFSDVRGSTVDVNTVRAMGGVKF
ncbi:MAG: outer membrane protein [Bosea sp. (in: a-proteobacteria)]